MIEYLLSLSILIAAVILIRAVFRKTVSLRAIYALWLVVVIRMLLPITLFEVALPLPKYAQAPLPEQTELSEKPEIAPSVPQASPIIMPASSGTDKIASSNPITEEERIPEAPETASPINPYHVADLVWLCGAAITAAWMLFTGVSYTMRLKKSRRLKKVVHGTKVYVSDHAGVPCIAGLSPSVYITPEKAATVSSTSNANRSIITKWRCPAGAIDFFFIFMLVYSLIHVLRNGQYPKMCFKGIVFSVSAANELLKGSADFSVTYHFVQKKTDKPKYVVL